ncbi:MAG: calcium-binding protein [Xanthobacteraceae bacterium]
MPAEISFFKLRTPRSIIEGDEGHNQLNGTKGDDVIYAYGGADKLWGHSGNDTLYGGDGRDSLVGDTGNDTMYGGEGDDWLDAAGGNDLLFGGKGLDIVSYQNASHGVYAIIGLGTVVEPPEDDRDIFGDDIEGIEGSGFDDRLIGNKQSDVLIGGNGNDELVGNDGNDYLNGDAGEDIIYGGGGLDQMAGGAGADTIFGGEGNFDYVNYAHSNGAIDVALADEGTSRNKGGDAEGDVLGSDIEWINGSRYNDTIAGNYADNDLSGFDGDDTLYGGGGDDRLYGDSTLAGDDTLYGGEGQDVLIGGGGDDWLIGGQGSDVIVTGEGKDILFFAPESVASLGGNVSVDRVTDFDTDGDKIDLKDFGYDDLDDLYDAGGHIVGSSNGTYIYFDASGQGVLLEGVSVRTIDESDFLF